MRSTEEMTQDESDDGSAIVDPIAPDPLSYAEGGKASTAGEERPAAPVGGLRGAGSMLDVEQEERGVATAAQAGIREPKRQPHPVARTSNVGDRIFRAVTTGFAAVIIAALLLMVGVLAIQGRLSITTFGMTFFTSSTWDPIRNSFGAGPAILGTLYTSLLALLMAGPVAVLVAIFLTEFSPLWARFGLGFLVELLAAVPSIVFGLWALYVLVPLVRDHVQPFFIGHFGNTPFFSGYPIGLGVFTASVILAIMILPTIAAISRDVMRAVPNSQRDAMLALGATRWETTWKIVVPSARSGIVGGIVLGLGRAVGETMAVQMVIGNTQTLSLSLFNFGTTIPATIVNQFTEATGDLYRSALIEMALVLMLVTITLNAIVRLLVWRVSR
jgi:phosphate transport system permease protein